MRLLVIDGHPVTGPSLVKALTEAGHVVDRAKTFTIGLTMSRRGNYDVIVADRPIAGDAGIHPIAAARAEGLRESLLIVSIHGHVDERVRGLRAGADDYLTKPYALVELLARLDALMRRRHRRVSAEEARLRIGDLEIDFIGRCVRRGGELLRLHPAAYRVLEYLMRHAGEVISRERMMDKVWGQRFGADSNSIDVHIARLRRIIDLPDRESLIETVRGVGYRVRTPANAAEIARVDRSSER